MTNRKTRKGKKAASTQTPRKRAKPQTQTTATTATTAAIVAATFAVHEWLESECEGAYRLAVNLIGYAAQVMVNEHGVPDMEPRGVVLSEVVTNICATDRTVGEPEALFQHLAEALLYGTPEAVQDQPDLN